jgi:acyl-CoA thioesterase-1
VYTAIVILATNYALRSIDPAVARRNLEAILAALEQAGVATLLAGMKAPRNMGADYVDRFDQVYPDLAEAHDVVYFPFFLKDVAAQSDLNQGDGIHPNAKGVAVIVENILPKVEKLIQKAREGREAEG